MLERFQLGTNRNFRPPDYEPSVWTQYVWKVETSQEAVVKVRPKQKVKSISFVCVLPNTGWQVSKSHCVNSCLDSAEGGCRVKIVQLIAFV